MNTLNLYIMVRPGLHQDSSISHDTLDQILKGVESGNRDNIYFYGLLKLYGISLSADAAIAAQHFLRASNLGHKDATTVVRAATILPSLLLFVQLTDRDRSFH